MELNQLEKIQEITKTQIPKRGIALKDVELIFNDFNVIKIPHVGKSDHFKFEDLQAIKYDAIEISNENHKNYLHVKKQNINTSVVAFSDTHKWNMYPEQDRLITVIDNLQNLSFESLKKALTKNLNYTYKEKHD